MLSPETLPEYQWSHVAFSFDGEKERLYVNGELVATHLAAVGAVPSTGPLEIGCAKGWGTDYFPGKIDNLLIYPRVLPAGEIETDMRNDFAPPKIELSGTLTEGLKEGTTEYPLHVHAVDGEAGFPGVGVKSITISVDGEVVDQVEQECPEGNCPMDREWVFDTGTYGFEAHEITVSPKIRLATPAAPSFRFQRRTDRSLRAALLDRLNPRPTKSNPLRGEGPARSITEPKASGSTSGRPPSASIPSKPATKSSNSTASLPGRPSPNRVPVKLGKTPSVRPGPPRSRAAA